MKKLLMPPTAHIYHNSKRFDAATEYEIEDHNEADELVALGALDLTAEKQPVVIDAPVEDIATIASDPFMEELPSD